MKTSAQHLDKGGPENKKHSPEGAHSYVLLKTRKKFGIVSKSGTQYDVFLWKWLKTGISQQA